MDPNGNCRIPRSPLPAAVAVAAAGQRTAGCGNSDTVSYLHSGCRPACISPPGAASGSYSARTNSVRGHGKQGDGSTESCCHWRSNLPVCVCAYTCVCVRRPSSVDAQTDCQSLGCMHDLSLSFLCKQQRSGSEQSDWQEVMGVGGVRQCSWMQSALTTKLCNLQIQLRALRLHACGSKLTQGCFINYLLQWGYLLYMRWGNMVTLCSPHSEKVACLILGLGPFCVHFACSSCFMVIVGQLLLK